MHGTGTATGTEMDVNAKHFHQPDIRVHADILCVESLVVLNAEHNAEQFLFSSV